MVYLLGTSGRPSSPVDICLSLSTMIETLRDVAITSADISRRSQKSSVLLHGPGLYPMPDVPKHAAPILTRDCVGKSSSRYLNFRVRTTELKNGEYITLLLKSYHLLAKLVFSSVMSHDYTGFETFGRGELKDIQQG